MILKLDTDLTIKMLMRGDMNGEGATLIQSKRF